MHGVNKMHNGWGQKIDASAYAGMLYVSFTLRREFQREYATLARSHRTLESLAVTSPTVSALNFLNRQTTI